MMTSYEQILYDVADGVATERGLNQPDGLHPAPAGVDVIVTRMLPKVEELLARARAARGS